MIGVDLLVLGRWVLTCQINIRSKVKVLPKQGVLGLIGRQSAALSEPHILPAFRNALSFVEIHGCALASLGEVDTCHCLRILLGDALTVTLFHAILMKLLRDFSCLRGVKQRLQLHSLVELLVN